ncbi:MAG: putative inorganic carbon transporter subunit DabA, partial [Ignavibacteria bacterium]
MSEDKKDIYRNSSEQFIQELKHFVPSQKTLKDFIHHNTLHAFQHKKFFDAIFEASEIFGYKVTLQLKDYRELFRLGRIKEYAIERAIITQKGESALKEWTNKVLFGEYDENINSNIGLLRSEWKRVYKVDIDSLVHPKLYRILASYLDQGIALWEFPHSEHGFMYDMRSLLKNSSISFFENKEVEEMFLNRELQLQEVLKILIGDESYFEQYLFDMVFSHPGWSGIVSVIEDSPDSLLLNRSITLHDMLLFEACIELDVMKSEYGKSLRPLSLTVQSPPLDVLGHYPQKELHTILRIWHEAFEWSYYDQVLGGIFINAQQSKLEQSRDALFQAVFCIDERECSLRRHIEFVEPTCETYGAPGFFGVEFYFKGSGSKFIEKLCPAPIMPKHIIIEHSNNKHEVNEVMFDKNSMTLFKGFFMTVTLGIYSIWKLIQTLLNPKMEVSISDAFSHVGKETQLIIEHQTSDQYEQGFQIGFTIEEMTDRIESFLKSIGMTHQFSSIVYMMSHGSSSANNPHHGAHDCGACSGRPGCVNARVFCKMANHPGVRFLLLQRGIVIPASTVFIPCMHDTASDLIEYYDESSLSDIHIQLHKTNKLSFEQALDLNAKERSRRFASIDTTSSLQSVRKAIEKRALSLFEPRPELGHGTNSLAIVGRRQLTRGLYLDRRA